MDLIDLDAARRALSGRVVRTPILHSEALDARAGATLSFKAEGLQRTGSFKVRGALHKIGSLSPAELAKGLITVSAGNAALGAAYAARVIGATLTVVMPETAVPAKLVAVAAMGARIEKDGITSATLAFARLHELIAEHGYTLVHPFDDPLVIAGAATATCELIEDCPDLDCIVVPTSGGGLLAGAVVAARALAPGAKVYGVQPEGSDGVVRSLRAGVPTAPPRIETIADGLTAPRPGVLNLEIIRDGATDVSTVSDAEILRAMGEVLRELRVLVEPAAAAGLAGVLSSERFRGKRVGIVLSGSNASPERIMEALATRRQSDH